MRFTNAERHIIIKRRTGNADFLSARLKLPLSRYAVPGFLLLLILVFLIALPVFLDKAFACSSAPESGSVREELYYWVWNPGQAKAGGQYLSNLLGSKDPGLNGAERKSPATIRLVISGFSLNRSGRVRGVVHPAMARFINRDNLKVYPLVTTSHGRAILSSQSIIRTAARSLRDFALAHGFAGIHLDIEYLPGTYVRPLASLLARMQQIFPEDLDVSMALFPQKDFPSRWAAFHDPEKLAPWLDWAVLMSYDLHRPGTEPGPVTDLDWAEENIRHFLRFMPARKLFVGVPAYGYLWKNNRKAIVINEGFPDRKSQASRRSNLQTEQLPSGVMKLRFYQNGAWLEGSLGNARTRRLMRRLAVRHSLAGIAVWQLGFIISGK